MNRDRAAATLRDELEAEGVSVSERITDRLARAHDASHYLMTPALVASPTDAAQVASTMAAAGRHGLTVTLRSGGTSLSGQASGPDLLVDTRRNFRQITVLDEGERVRAQPGATVRAVNARLNRFGRKLGPDPASEIACTIGGVVANNSSGMTCGTHANTYRTLDTSVLILSSGTVVDTAHAEADELLKAAEPEIHAGLLDIRDRIRSNADWMSELERQYSLKNTIGYGLNSFVDHDEPARILEHLAVGSEGTLAFIAEATFRTMPATPHCMTGLLVFENLSLATASLPTLVAAGYTAIELLDASSLRVAQADPSATDELRAVIVRDHAALLIELQEESAEALQSRLDGARAALDSIPVVGSRELTSDAETRASLWHIRKGLFSAIAGSRPPGTTALLEDIAVPVLSLNEVCDRLVALFDRHGYEGSVIFGHAKDGNIHFLLNERFGEPDGVKRYEEFTEEMVDLVLALGGTLKAEHGTGRIMAPYVRRQFGDELYSIMWEVKHLLDPGGVLSPGVVLTTDDRAHVRDLKSAPSVEAEVDRCVECGYCEPVCPSRDLTLTPRERIVLRRELQRARDAGDTALAAEIEKDYAYEGVDTCAVDGMCKTACPVLINTGDLVRRLRNEQVGGIEQAVWRGAAKHWGSAVAGGGNALTMASVLPAISTLATRAAREVFGHDAVPLYSSDLPRGGSKRREVKAQDPVAVYFPSCTTTMFGHPDGGSVSKSFLRLCERVGVSLVTPSGVSALCCGTPWKSKGMSDGYEIMREKVLDALIGATNNGELPIVCDASSCTEGLQLLLESNGMRVVDAVSFVDEVVLPLLPPMEKHVMDNVTIHPTCSSTQLGINPALDRVARAIARTVVVPDDWGCCGFAGDRGMLHPELTASATAGEAQSVLAANSVAHVSTNRTCELGMTRATGRDYRHILELLDAVVASAESELLSIQDPSADAR